MRAAGWVHAGARTGVHCRRACARGGGGAVLGTHEDLQLLVQPVAQHEVVRHGQAVRLHGVVLAKVERLKLVVKEVGHLLLPAAAHAGPGGHARGGAGGVCMRLSAARVAGGVPCCTCPCCCISYRGAHLLAQLCGGQALRMPPDEGARSPPLKNI